GFGLATTGFVLLAGLGPQASYLALATCLALLGLAVGMIFPTLTLSYQSAVEFRELGVAPSLNQFCRSVGSALGSAVFGRILALPFTTSLHSTLPAPVSEWLDSPAGAGFQDPQSVLNPSTSGTLRDLLVQAFPSAPDVADLVVNAIRDSLGSALHLVFLLGAAVMLTGFFSSIIWREVPMRRSAGARSSADKPVSERVAVGRTSRDSLP